MLLLLLLLLLVVVVLTLLLMPLLRVMVSIASTDGILIATVVYDRGNGVLV